MERRHHELPRDADLILACAAGGRSQQALNYLRHMGHPRVRNLTGGMAAWLAHGLPVNGV
jgi:rhodanese-related sulfurtransferase